MFDEKQFKEDMKKALNKKERKNDPMYLKIIDGSYWKMSDIDFEITATKVLDSVKDGNVPSMEYTKLFAVYKQLHDLKLIDTMSIEELSNRFLLGFKIALTKQTELGIEEDYEGLDSTDDAIRNFAEQCRDAKLQYSEDIEKNKVAELFRKLIDDVDCFYKEVVSDFKNVAIFEKYDMDLLYSKLIQISNYDMYNFISIVNSRYSENKKLLKFDKKNLKKLAKVIEEMNADAQVTIKTALLNKLKDTINVLCAPVRKVAAK